MLFRSDRKSTRLNSSHTIISYAVFCLKKKKTKHRDKHTRCNTLSREYAPHEQAGVVAAPLLLKIHTGEWMSAIIAHPTSFASLSPNPSPLHAQPLEKLIGR